MSDLQQIQIKLPVETVQFLETCVASGEYPTVNDAVLEGIDLLKSHIVDSDDWIRSEVLPALAEYDADTTRGLTPAQMRQTLAADVD